MTQTPEAARCARHPHVETYLHCSRCDTPICPDCLVHTPVGARCRDCAGLRRLPTFRIDPLTGAKGAAAALVVAIVGTIIADQVRGFGFWLMLLIGLLTAEAASAATNRRRGPALGLIAAISTGVGIILGRAAIVMLSASPLSFGAKLGVALQVAVSVNVFTALMIIVASVIAYYRLRS